MKSTATLLLLSVILAAIATVAQAGHFYTTSKTEKDKALTEGYQLQGIAGYVFKNPSPSKNPSTGPVYHAHSTYSGDHAYTAILAEQQNAISIGYIDMGIAFYLYTKPSGCRAPLNILFKPSFPYDHFYTTNKAEAAAAIAQGYLERGILGYVYTDKNNTASPLYQMYKA
ncbi:hypothetical protein FBU30_004315 [Linnemannia zychae]|nr:hypothetical protein FBU30_004315 [Linnemannia zychae]